MLYRFFFFTVNLVNLLVFLLVIAGMAKSAQIFFHIWLPDAMEGPTPVSALIHAATMVTAGIFLLLRFHNFIILSEYGLVFLLIIGAFTAFVSGTIALVQYDLKKIVAYSTCSQLGLMFYALGLCNFSVSFFHLFNHAFFKALLFLSSGSIIHALNNEQDIRKMGGLFLKMPFTYCCLLIATLSIIGFPFLSGFYSKEIILELGYLNYTHLGIFSYILVFFTTFLTACYSFRLLFIIFFDVFKGFKINLINFHTEDIITCCALSFLVFGSLFSGFWFHDIFIGIGSIIWYSNFFFDIKDVLFITSEFLFLFIKLLPIILCFCSLILVIVNYYYLINFVALIKIKVKFLRYLKNSFIFIIYKLFINKYYFDIYYNKVLFYSVYFFIFPVFYKFIDRGILEFLGSVGLYQIFSNVAKIFNRLNVGSILFYNYIILCFFFFVATYFVYDFIFYISLFFFFYFY